MRSTRGFTLTEVIITLGILSIILVPLLYIFTESSKRANITLARDYVKLEANKVINLLENDLTQTRRGSFVEQGNTITIKVRKNDKEDVDLKYTYNKPNLHRYLEGKCWLVSKIVDSFDLSKSNDTPGKMVLNIVVKSDQIGIKDEEQPTYEQQKIIMLMEDATEDFDQYWREVGDVSKFFSTQGNLLAGIKEDAKQLVEDFSKTWMKALGDIKNMSVAELKKVKTDLQNNLKDIKTNLTDINKEILDLDWHAFYNRGFLGIGNGRKKRKANAVKNLVSGYQSLDEMNWEQVKDTGSGMKEEAIKAMYDAKVQLFEGEINIKKNLSEVEAQLGKAGNGELD